MQIEDIKVTFRIASWMSIKLASFIHMHAVVVSRHTRCLGIRWDTTTGNSHHCCPHCQSRRRLQLHLVHRHQTSASDAETWSSRGCQKGHNWSRLRFRLSRIDQSSAVGGSEHRVALETEVGVGGLSEDRIPCVRVMEPYRLHRTFEIRNNDRLFVEDW